MADRPFPPGESRLNVRIMPALFGKVVAALMSAGLLLGTTTTQAECQVELARTRPRPNPGSPRVRTAQRANPWGGRKSLTSAARSTTAIDGELDDEHGSIQVGVYDDGDPAHPQGPSGSGDLPTERYVRIRSTVCVQVTASGALLHERVLGACPAGWAPVPTEPCPVDSWALGDLWVQHLGTSGLYGPLEFVEPGGCATEGDLSTAARAAFASMQVPAPEARLQSGSGSVLLVNAWYPVHTTAYPVILAVTLLEVPLEIQAVPIWFEWDFTDAQGPRGGKFGTANPGRRWEPGDPLPDATWVAHAWSGLRESLTVTLTTTWIGQFREANATTWTDIPGTLTTVSRAGPFSVSEAPCVLVCDSLTGDRLCGRP